MNGLILKSKCLKVKAMKTLLCDYNALCEYKNGKGNFSPEYYSSE